MKPGPTVAQQLGPMGVNLGKVIEETNEATSGFKGMKVPVIIDVNPKTKEFKISVSSPPVSELIKKELKLSKASAQPGKAYVGNLSIEEAIKIAKTKMPDMLARSLKAAVKLVVGSCISLGIFVESKKGTEMNEEIDSGKYDSEISQEKTEPSPEKRAELDKFFKEVASQQEAQKAAEEKAKEEAEAAKAESTEESEETKETETPEEKK